MNNLDQVTEAMQEALPAWLEAFFARLDGRDVPEPASRMPNGEPWPQFLDSPEKRSEWLAELRQEATRANVVAPARPAPRAIIGEWTRPAEDVAAMKDIIRQAAARGEMAVLP